MITTRLDVVMYSMESKPVFVDIEKICYRSFAENVFAYTDTEMQTEIDTYISRGQATFNVQLLVSLKLRA